MEKIRLGIDLGTTNTLVYYMKDGKLRLIKIDGEDMLPSVLYVDEDKNILIGKKALQKGRYDPNNVIRSSKTYMGDNEKVWKIRGFEFTPTDVASEILKKVKEATIKKIKLDESTQIDAVITIPANFTTNSRDETARAAKMAGINPIKIISEPRAAAIANVRELGVEDRNIFVVDLGGGTFDICAMRVHAGSGEWETLNIDGRTSLGGDDFDNCIVEFIKKVIGQDNGIDLDTYEKSGLSYSDYWKLIGEIRYCAVEAKKELSEEESTEIDIITEFDGYEFDPWDLTRDQFENILCKELFETIRDRILKTFDAPRMKSAGLTPADFDDIILAGGSCYMPKIREIVQEIFPGKSINSELNRSEMVAIGACYVADAEDDLSSAGDMIAHSLGIQVVDNNGVFKLEKLLARGDMYPCEKEKIFTTTVDDQKMVTIDVYEAADDMEDYEEIYDNGKPVHILYGSFVLSDIERAPKGVPRISVKFNYDSSCLLSVTAKDEKTGTQREIVIKKGVKTQKEVTSEPVDFVLLMDTSASMTWHGRIGMAKDAAYRLINEIIDLNSHRLGVIGFADNVSVVSALCNNKNTLKIAVDKLRAQGGTYMNKGIDAAAGLFGKTDRRRVILLVSDGAPQSAKAAEESAAKAMNKGIDIVTIAVGVAQKDREFYKKLASKPEFAFSIDNMEQLGTMFKTAVEQYLARV